MLKTINNKTFSGIFLLSGSFDFDSKLGALTFYLSKTIFSDDRKPLNSTLAVSLYEKVSVIGLTAADRTHPILRYPTTRNFGQPNYKAGYASGEGACLTPGIPLVRWVAYPVRRNFRELHYNAGYVSGVGGNRGGNALHT